jgi:hypothetical protein
MIANGERFAIAARHSYCGRLADGSTSTSRRAVHEIQCARRPSSGPQRAVISSASRPAKAGVSPPYERTVHREKTTMSGGSGPRWDDPRNRDDTSREIEIYWVELGRGPASNRRSENDIRECDHHGHDRAIDLDPRERRHDRRDVFLDDLELPRGLEQEVVLDGDHRYEVNGEESARWETVRRRGGVGGFVSRSSLTTDCIQIGNVGRPCRRSTRSASPWVGSCRMRRTAG